MRSYSEEKGRNAHPGISLFEANMQIVLVEGDGIGLEVTQAACRVVAATGVKIDWVSAPPAFRPPSSSANRCRKKRSK